jgi:hypothetical protein
MMLEDEHAKAKQEQECSTSALETSSWKTIEGLLTEK